MKLKLFTPTHRPATAKSKSKKKQGAMGPRHPAGGERDLYRMIETDNLQAFLSVY